MHIITVYLDSLLQNRLQTSIGPGGLGIVIGITELFAKILPHRLARARSMLERETRIGSMVGARQPS